MTLERERTWENRIWTLAQVLMSAAVFWGASTLWELSKSVARIDVLLANAVTMQAVTAAAQSTRDKGQDDSLDALRKLVEDMRADGNRSKK